MQLNEGQEREYERRHNPIWPELKSVLEEHGVSNYSIFLHPDTLQLLAYAEIDNEELWDSIADPQIFKNWWAHMGELMAVNEDSSPKSLL